ncbi:MAG: hypothetical protein IMY73_01745 [Bacteroidetes bacterium]|nr:hypothetical protein [Bacteroidota bacterium]
MKINDYNIEFENEKMFRNAINITRLSLKLQPITINDRDWFDNAFVNSIEEILEVMKPVFMSLEHKDTKVVFNLSLGENILPSRIGEAMERTLLFFVFKRWRKTQGVEINCEEVSSSLKHIVLGVGANFKRKNVK